MLLCAACSTSSVLAPAKRLYNIINRSIELIAQGEYRSEDEDRNSSCNQSVFNGRGAGSVLDEHAGYSIPIWNLSQH